MARLQQKRTPQEENGLEKLFDAATVPHSGNDTSIIPILTSQRDRYRSRNLELEQASLYLF